MQTRSAVETRRLASPSRRAGRPTAQIAGCPTADVKVGSQAALTVSASDSAGSGLKADPTGRVALDTASIGTKTRQVIAEDNVGHQVAKSCGYRVIWDWTGLFQPIDNGSVLNRAKAGSPIPVKLSLDGTPVAGSNTVHGMAILASEPTSTTLTCAGGTPDDVDETSTATTSG